MPLDDTVVGDKLETITGTRLLSSTFGLVGKLFPDTVNAQRIWKVLNTLAPLEPFRGYKSYPRLRVVDQEGFVSFIHYMDYSLLTGFVKQGALDPYSGLEYHQIGDFRNGWRGLYADAEDLEDDLHIRELEIRETHGWDLILPCFSLTRYVHTSERKDECIVDELQFDADPLTGYGPDMRLETIRKRWAQKERWIVPWP